MTDSKNNRTDIIKEIIDFKMLSIDSDTRELIINNNWGLDEEEFDKCDYPYELKTELLTECWSKHDVSSEFYDPLIRKVLLNEFLEYTNQELKLLYYEITGVKMDIIEEQKKSDDFFSCPCCLGKTLSERGQYFICSVCDWEDDGIDAEHYSHCNGMKLSVASDNYRKRGSIYKNK